MRPLMLVTLALLAGCLGPRQDPSAFYLLSPVPSPPASEPMPVTVGIGPVSIPGYLDRPQIVVRLSDNEVALADADRWAEPLVENVVRVLEENLSRLLPASAYVRYPWYESEAPDYGVALDIRRFEADASGGIVLDVAWQLSGDAGVLEAGSALISESAGGPGQAAAVAAQSRALAELSQRIAAGVRRAAR